MISKLKPRFIQKNTASTSLRHQAIGISAFPIFLGLERANFA